MLHDLHVRTIRRRHSASVVALALAIAMLWSPSLEAHGVSSKDARYLLSLDGPAIIPLMYLGAKHMVTGYDHLLFLVGVIFFLYRMKHIAIYVTLFAVGHSTTMLFGVLTGISANARWSVAIATPRTASAAVRTRSETIIRSFRFQRSAATPAGSAITTQGTSRAKAVNPALTGECVSSRTSSE